MHTSFILISDVKALALLPIASATALPNLESPLLSVRDQASDSTLGNHTIIAFAEFDGEAKELILGESAEAYEPAVHTRVKGVVIVVQIGAFTDAACDGVKALVSHVSASKALRRLPVSCLLIKSSDFDQSTTGNQAKIRRFITGPETRITLAVQEADSVSERAQCLSKVLQNAEIGAGMAQAGFMSVF